MRYALARVQRTADEKMQDSQTEIPSASSGSTGAGLRPLLHGPLSKSTWTDARTLMLVATFTLLVKSDQAATVLNWISGPSGFKPKLVPVLFATILLYFLLVFLAHTVADLVSWWPNWHELQLTNKKTSRLLAAFVAIRFTLECGVPVVFAILALK